jgi:hypothetical protein
MDDECAVNESEGFSYTYLWALATHTHIGFA